MRQARTHTFSGPHAAFRIRTAEQHMNQRASAYHDIMKPQAADRAVQVQTISAAPAARACSGWLRHIQVWPFNPASASWPAGRLATALLAGRRAIQAMDPVQ